MRNPPFTNIVKKALENILIIAYYIKRAIINSNLMQISLHQKYDERRKEMKASIIKKLMAGALTVSLVMAPAFSAFATTITNVESKVEEAISSGTSGEVTTVAEVPNTSSVAGVKTTVGGVYLATKVNGSIVSTSAAAIAESYGLAGNEKAYAKFSNLDAKKSPLAMQAVVAAAASQGAEVGPVLNVELGKMTAGKYSLLPSDGAAIRLSFGIPKSFVQAGKTYAVVVVRAGGAVSILQDIDENPNTVTFDTTGGAGAYAIIRY